MASVHDNRVGKKLDHILKFITPAYDENILYTQMFSFFYKE